MGLFGFGSKKKYSVITEADQAWVEDNFKWLMDGYGYPVGSSKSVAFDKEYFPISFKSSKLTIDDLIEDLTQLMLLDTSKVNVVPEKDLRDLPQMPYGFSDQPLDTALVVTESGYDLIVSQQLVENPINAFPFLVRDFTKMRLHEQGVKYDTGTDQNLFVYLAAVFFGYGPLLLNLQSSASFKAIGFWENRSIFIAEMPLEVMMYCLAFKAHMIGESAPEWRAQLKADARDIFDRAAAYLRDYPSELYDDNEVKANTLAQESYRQFDEKDYDAAIETTLKIIETSTNPHTKMDALNNVGYYYSLIEKFEESILHFKKAIEIWPEYSYAISNWGYALIRLGQLEQGYAKIEEAVAAGNSDPAYVARNKAVYHHRKGDLELAKQHFETAFEESSGEVDLLEYHYADYLLDTGQEEAGMEYLRKSVEKGDCAAIRKMEKLGKS